jgi:DNA-binding PadR family transcriptional regulator
LLKALAKKEMSGYALMAALKEMSGKRPSPGSVYPLLESLKSEGLVSCRIDGRRKIYSMTAKGKDLAHEYMCRHEEIHERFNQMFSIACSLLDEKEVKKVRYMLDAFHDGYETHFDSMGKDIIDFKFNLSRILKEGDKQQAVKAKAIINRSSAELKRLFENGK